MLVIHAVMSQFVGFTMLCLPCNDPDYSNSTRKLCGSLENLERRKSLAIQCHALNRMK